MALSDLAPGLLLDGASGLVLIAFGVLAVLVRPRRAAMIGFAVFAIAFGTRAIWSNVLRRLITDTVVPHVDAALFFASAIGLAAFGWAYMGDGMRRSDAAIAVAVGAIPVLLYSITYLTRGLPFLQVDTTIGEKSMIGAFYGVLALLALRCAREPDERVRRVHAFVALALVWYPFLSVGITFVLSTVFTGSPIPWIAYGLFVPPAFLAALWIRAIPTAGRIALAIALAIPALCIVGEIMGIVIPDASNSGALGAARTLSVVMLLFAFARGGLLGGRIAIRRGTIATALLAVVLIVAQVMQNFLAAQYGLLMGGVVAGAFLFAAQPLQRAAERSALGLSAPAGADALEGRGSPHRADTLATDISDETAYRNALRVALRDKRLTRDEEVHLHRIATRLGIPGDRAHELLAEVEREVGDKEAR